MFRQEACVPDLSDVKQGCPNVQMPTERVLPWAVRKNESRILCVMIYRCQLPSEELAMPSEKVREGHPSQRLRPLEQQSVVVCIRLNRDVHGKNVPSCIRSDTARSCLGG